MRAFLVLQVGEDDLQVTSKLPQDLAACAARRRRLVGIRDDRNTRERAMPLRDRLEHRNALSANRQPVSGVLDIAAGYHASVGRFESGADVEVRKGSVRMFARAPR